MSGQRWGSYPSWWVLSHGLPRLQNAARNGPRVAALRTYLALAVLVDFHTRHVAVSISDLEAITGMSRPMVVAGTRVLEGITAHQGVPKSPTTADLSAPMLPVVQVHRSGKTTAFTLLRDHSSAFAKVPRDLLRRELRGLPTRGTSALNAVKLYLALLSVRPNTSDRLPISHDKLVEYTGIRPDRLRSAIDVLFEHRLIRLEQIDAEDPKRPGHRRNVYYLLGLEGGGNAASGSAPTKQAGQARRK